MDAEGSNDDYQLQHLQDQLPSYRCSKSGLLTLFKTFQEIETCHHLKELDFHFTSWGRVESVSCSDMRYIMLRIGMSRSNRHKGWTVLDSTVCHPRSMRPHLPSSWALVTCFVLQSSGASKSPACYSPDVGSVIATPQMNGRSWKTLLHKKTDCCAPDLQKLRLLL